MHASASDLPSHRIEAFSGVRSDLGPPNEGEPLAIRVIGVGGGGCNAVDRMVVEGLTVGEVWALNTDAQHLLGVKAHHKLLLGRHVCRGRSANADPKVGELAAEEARLELAETLKGVRLAFLLAGLGGGTGSGSSPVIAKIAKETRTTTVAFVTQPFTVEGKVRLENARASLDRLRATADFVSVFPNDRLISEHPGLSLRDALRKADEELWRPVRALHRVVRRADFPRLRRRLRGTTVSGAASADAPRQRGYVLAMERALQSLAHLKDKRPNSAVVAIGTGGDLNQGERDAMLRMALDALAPEGTVLWGYYDDKRLEGTCEVSVLLSRVDGAGAGHDAETVS
jgi:cell division protein FtsZ